MAKLCLGYSNTSDSKLEFEANAVIEGFTGNSYFPDSEPMLLRLKTVTTGFSTSRVLAAQGGKAAKTARDTKRKELVAVLIELGLWAMATAKGNEDALATTGYRMYKRREPRYLTVPNHTLVKAGKQPGQLEVSIGAVTGAQGYQFYITDAAPTETTVWKSEPSSKANYVFSNLQQGRQYWVRVGVTGARGQMVYSPVVSSFVL